MSGRPNRYLVNIKNIPSYSPANHTGTVSHRLIGPETVGSVGLELLDGYIEPGEGAVRHAHPGIEQVCYLLSGTAHVEVGDESFEMEAGDCCYFPPYVEHVFQVTGDVPVRMLVVYSPPYEERKDRVILPASS